MGKRLVVVLIGLIVIVGISKVSFAAMCGAAEHKDVSKTARDKSEAVNAGNKICPVMGEKINEKTKATYEYEGKVYNFCCSGCINEFKKNPEKHIKKIEMEGAKEESSHEHLMH